MEMPITVSLDDEAVRFTPDGRISVLDAIKAVTLSDCPDLIWEDVKKEHPEIVGYCGSHSFQREGSLPVMGREGWDMMWVLLIDYLMDPGRICSRQQGN